MPKPDAKKYTPIFEFVGRLEGFERPLIGHLEDKEYQRLLDVLEERSCTDRAFFGFSEARGLETYFNLSKIQYIDLLDYLGGIPAERQPELSEKQESRVIEERMESEETVLLWVWTTADKEPRLHYSVNYHDWCAIQRTLEENDQLCVGFEDQDGERIILPLKHLVAIEMCDEFFHKEDVVDRFTGKCDKRNQDEEPIEVSIG
jgi:hypothetical protein